MNIYVEAISWAIEILDVGRAPQYAEYMSNICNFVWEISHPIDNFSRLFYPFAAQTKTSKNITNW